MASLKSNNPISCNFPSFHSHPRSPLNPRSPHFWPQKTLLLVSETTQFLSTKPPHFHLGTPLNLAPELSPFVRRGRLHQTWKSAFSRENPEDHPLPDDEGSSPVRVSGSGGKDASDWITSLLLFGLWAALMYYVFQLTPDQTPSRDMYFLEKLLNLKGDDGFQMNEVLVALWYIMGLWPVVYSMLLLPSGRSSRNNVPVWPFLVLSCFGGAYVLIPYFVLWRPPPPAVEEEEITRWPLNFLESKITAGILTAAGLGLVVYAGVANGDTWKEFYQYFRESKFIHVTCLDFSLLAAFCPFWVYNDMTARNWFDRGSWLLPVALIPFIGPALYLLLRPSLSTMPVSITSKVTEKD